MTISKTTKIEINDQFKKAIDLMKNTDKSIFITGKAGTGPVMVAAARLFGG